MSGKFALLIGNTDYIDSGLAQLTAPGKDTEDFARVLQDQEICAFDEVKVLLNQLSSSVIEAIDEFFDQKKPDDLLVLYFSGHGVRDELGSLYLAVRNTIRNRLRSTAIKSDYIREAMDQSRSRREVLILDCCNSGAFSQGAKAATGVSIGTASAFEAGYGRIILTASDSTQFAWEGDQVIGETDNSLFTHYLVEGLEGEADLDSDGRITVDELYDYAYERVRLATPKQTPSKFSSKQQGEIVLRQSMRIEDIKPVPLPDALVDEIEDTRPYVREVAVQKLERILKGKNIGLARSAREALEKIIADENTTRRVAQAATLALESIRETAQLATPKEDEERKTLEEEAAKQLATPKVVEERLARERKERDRIAREKSEAERLAQEKLERERLAPRKTEGASLALEKAVTSRTVVSRRTLFSLLLAGLVIIASIGGYYILQSIGPESTPTVPATEKQIIPITTAIDTRPAATTAVPEHPSQTPSPISTPSVETYVYIAASRAYLYKGPALAYGLVVQKSYPKGEKFTVIARNASGLWLLSKASDGIEGWLYIGWVNLDIDASIIPTASYIPPLAANATKSKGGGGQPEPTCVSFCN